MTKLTNVHCDECHKTVNHAVELNKITWNYVENYTVTLCKDCLHKAISLLGQGTDSLKEIKIVSDLYK